MAHGCDRVSGLVVGFLVLSAMLILNQASYAQTNLVVNGSFEKVDANGFPLSWGLYWGSDGQVKPNANVGIKTDGAADGSQYLAIDDQNKAGAAVLYSEPILVKPGATYTISVKSKGKTGTISCRLRTFSKADAGPMESAAIINNLAVNIKSVDGEWVESSDVHVMPDNAKMARVLIYTSSATFGSGSFDDVVVIEGGNTQMVPKYDLATERYLKPVFPEVTIHEGLRFGSAVDLRGVDQQLLLDIYEPKGDTERLRPAILWLHGGGLKAGDRKQGYIQTVSTEFAKRGYVCVSADYRLGTSQDDELKVLDNAVTDAISAYNWILDNGAKYGIDTNRVIVGGGSAGGYLAVNVGTLDDASRGHFDKRPLKAIVNLWGSPALNRYVGKIDKTDPPMIIIHGTADRTVPFSQSEYLAGELTKNSVYNILYPLKDADHTPVSYMEEMLGEISRFLYKVLGSQSK